MEEYYERYWDREGDTLSDFNLKWPVLAPLIPKKTGVSILDFGCGKGHILSELGKLNPTANLVGLDVSESALKVAHERLPGVQFYYIEDGGTFPLDDTSVDFIFTSEVIEHVYDTENAFRELARVLRPGGTLLLTTPYHGLVKNLAITLFGFDRHFDPSSPHVRFFTNRSLSRMLERNGLTITRRGYYGRFWPVPHSVYVVAEKRRS